MICAKNYETVSKGVKVMPKILWPLFFRTRCSSINARSLLHKWQMGTKMAAKWTS